MKNLVKISWIAFLTFMLVVCGFFFYAVNVTKDARLLQNKFVTDETPQFYDINGEGFCPQFMARNGLAEYEELPKHLKDALICTEDKRFYSHNGVDYIGIMRATFNNIKSFSFKEGASTITQQLIKNTHLSGDKTIKRKLTEIKLAREAERRFTKEEILVAYFNTVYFGNNCYGIKKSAKYYFNKDVKDLTLSESATLVGLLKAPSRYDPYTHYSNAIKRRNLIIKLMKNQGKISENEYLSEIEKEIILTQKNENSDDFYFKRCMEEANENVDPYTLVGCKIYTYFSPESQNILCGVLASIDIDCGKTAIIINDGKILAYLSTENYEHRSEPASTIKPLLVYGPAIDSGVISEATKINDEECDFDGYKPKNFSNKYYGYIDCKTALSYSLNVPAVKILNALTPAKANAYLNRTSLKNGNSGLSSALGNIDTLPSIREITESYSCFNGEGYFKKGRFIQKIEDKNGKIIYSDKNTASKVFDKETSYIISDMLRECAKNGTSKKLYNDKFEIYAKTGTNGNKDGNKDALCVAYTSQDLFGINLFAKDDLMDNSVTGGSYPTLAMSEIISRYYKDNYPKNIDIDGNLKKVALSKYAYDNDNILLLCDDEAFEKDIFYSYFKSEYIPKIKDDSISNPIVKYFKIVDKTDYYEINYEKNNYTEFEIFKCVDGKKKVKIYSSENGEKFTDYDICHKEIQYSVVPYAVGKNGKIYGKEIYLPKIKNKIKNNHDTDDKWLEEY